MDGSWTEYNERSLMSAYIDMNITICPDCSVEKYPKFYGTEAENLETHWGMLTLFDYILCKIFP